jgi:hypothetical protein
VYNGEQLIFQAIHKINGFFKDWKPDLIREIEDRKKKGFIVLVEEKTDHISQYATKFSFEDIDEDEGRVNYYVALDWYFSIENMGNLILPAENQRLAIRENRIEKLQDEKGRTKYNVDWDSFSGGQRTILLCVMAAVGLNPLSSLYLEQFFGGLDGGAPEEDQNPYRSYNAITVEFDKEKSRRLDKLRKQELDRRNRGKHYGQTEPI